MNETEFLNRFHQDKPMLKAWGNYVTDMIKSSLEMEYPDLYSKMLQIPPAARLKTDDSIIQKAFYRGKNYEDPYDCITDKVGTRFVVLTENDVSLVAGIVEQRDHWSYSRDRDYEDERSKNPLLFTYQSIHFILRNRENVFYKGITIPDNTPCEVQIRTLLQHAYCELSHDLIYKPGVGASPQVQRLMARSMALIETTDDMFIKALNEMKQTERPLGAFATGLRSLYSDKLGKLNYEYKLNSIILDSYKPITDALDIEEIRNFYNDTNNEFILEQIKEKNRELFFRQPVALLLYYLVKNREYLVKSYWPITDMILRKIFIDLGIAFDN